MPLLPRADLYHWHACVISFDVGWAALPEPRYLRCGYADEPQHHELLPAYVCSDVCSG